MSGTLQPVAESDRIELFDALRGFALLGILLVNFWGDEGTRFAQLDTFISGALDVLVSNSFYPLYSFLFGLGFAVQLARAKRRGSGSTLLYFRRMLALFLIGTVHVVLIWRGDILVAYSILGLALIPLHRLPQKAVLVMALALFVALVIGPSVIRPRVNARRALSSTPAAQELVLGARALDDRIMNNRSWPGEEVNTSYAQAVRARWALHMNNIRSRSDWLSWALSDILLYFLIGLLVGRSRVLEEASARRRTLFRAWGITAVIGVGGAIAWNLGWLDSRPWLNQLGYIMANPGLTAFYLMSITLLFTFTARGRRAFGIFVHPGRMGLTNYLMQSVVMTVMSESYGLGWSPSTTAWVALNLAFFFAVQVPLSRWWLTRYRYGPVEWLWRSVTYGVAQPFRIARTMAAPAAAVVPA
jgi:uncharacterized protein